ncbi:PREDICTED: alpha-protein kinase 2 [Chrysochloris asiatica]|uniref:Alpha-protein kinase 2 n=1 Tax=Chrysochloris asiatica TaxID=185453 RepID=A0A9B0WHN6_CHRAS|nr:PREDICTED: alpha-protein kinase 2 [Chrysochloris asiatica]
MSGVGVPPRCTLCFLSTLLSQKVPEKSDIVLRCIISGQPKPEVTWYKNGQAIGECDASSYEFFENQYIHVLHLYCCTTNDAAVYQISAKNCFGMICCSASIEVERSSENPQLPPNRKDDVDMGWEHETEPFEAQSSKQVDEKEPPYKEEERTSLGKSMSADLSPTKSNHSDSLQSLANDDTQTSSSEKLWDIKGTRQTQVTCDPNNTEEIAEGFLFPISSIPPRKQNGYSHGTVHCSVSQPMDGVNNEDPNDDNVLNSSHQQPRVQKYISFSQPLSEANTSTCSGTPNDRQLCMHVSSEDSDSDYELCPEITLTYTEEFSDDDLEYLECSDVMTDYSNTIWQRYLRGTECVFLLESDDEEMEFSECGLAGGGHFLSEMSCEVQVSDNIEPRDTLPGLCGYHSKPQQVGVRSSGASTLIPSPLQVGMTLTLGPHQDGTSTVTDQGKYKVPSASGVAGNVYPGIQGETRDNCPAEEEVASGNLLTMDSAPMEMKPGELETSGTCQCVGTTAEKRVGEKNLWSMNSQKPASVRRPGAKGKLKKLKAHLKENATEGTLDLLHPREPARHPLTQSDKKELSHASVRTTNMNLQFHTEDCTISPQAEQEVKTLQTPTDSLLREGGGTNFQGEETQLTDLCEASQLPEQSESPQVQTQETIGDSVSLSQRPASVEPAALESSLMGATMSESPNSGGIHEESASLAQYLEVGSCTWSPQHEEQDQERGDNTAGGPRGDLDHKLSCSDTNSGLMVSCELSVHCPQDGCVDFTEPEVPFVASPDLVNTILTLENGCDGPSGREAVCGLENFEAGDGGTYCDAMDSPVGAVDTYLPQETCSRDLELVDAQNQASDLCSPDDKMLEGLLNAQSSEPPQSTCDNGRDRDLAMPPVSSSTFTWNISQEVHEGATGGNVAELEDHTSILVCMRRTDHERLSLSHSGEHEERQPLSSEYSSCLQFKEGGEDGSTTKDTIDTPASHSSIVTFLEETPTMLTGNSEFLPATKEREDTSVSTIGTRVLPAKCLAASITENSAADGTKETLPQTPDENGFQLPSSVPWGHSLNVTTAETIKELPCMVSSAPENQACVPQLLEGKDFYSDSALQIDNLCEDKNQMVDGADHRRLEENFQEKGSETKQRSYQEKLPHQGSLPEAGFQVSLPATSAAQEEVKSLPWDHLPGNSREEKGTDVTMVAESIVEEDSKTLSDVLPLSQYLLQDSEENGPGSGEPDNKLKVITLEAPVSEIWSPRQPADSESKESEAVPLTPDRIWALSEVPMADTLVCELDSSKITSPVNSAQCESSNREVHRCQEQASHDGGRNLSARYLRQLRRLESSVDPVDEEESGTANSFLEVSKTRGKENVDSVNPNQKENQLKLAHPASFKLLLTCPQILESSVDPIDEAGIMEWAEAEPPEPPESTLGPTGEESQSKDRNSSQKVTAQPAIGQVPYPEESGDTILSEKSINQNPEDREKGQAEQSENDKVKVEAQLATLQVSRRNEIILSEGSRQQVQGGNENSFGEAVQSKHDESEVTSPTLPLSSCLAIMPCVSVGVDSNSTGQIHDIAEPRNHPYVFSDSKERRCAKCLPFTSSPDESSTNVSVSKKSKESKIETPQIREPKPPNSSASPAMTRAFISGECVAENSPKFEQDPSHQGSTLSSMKKSRQEEMPSHMATKPGKFPGARSVVTRSEEAKKKQELLGSGYVTEGVKKKILSKVAALRLRLEEKENARKNSSFLKKIPKLEASVSFTEEKKDQKKPPCKREGRAPVLLKKIQAEMFPHHSGNVKLSCQFAEIHEDSTIWWTKDAESISQVQRSAGDHSTVSLAIVQASPKDQGLYYCCINNSYGKVTAEFNLTAEVLKQLLSHQDSKGCEEIEFSQLIFKDDFLSDSYFGGRLRGQIVTEQLHFGEGVHRKAFRSTVMQGLMPVFQPGHACVLKVHNAVAYGTRTNDELIQRNYKLATQECYVQNTARHYAKIYAAEAQPLEGFGEVPEIIPIFLIHRPENNIPYATVEEELMGEFVKYSIRDGKEINFLRRESEAGQKCCTFQHWVYQKTSGCLLVTDMQGVGMKLTDVGIATLAKGYKGFKGNCPMTFIDQFKALHQCNKYCKMLGLKSLQTNHQKPKKPSVPGKSKVQPNPTMVKKTVSQTPAGKT